MKEGCIGLKRRRAQGEVIAKGIRHPRQPEYTVSSCELTLSRVDVVIVVNANDAAESLVAEQQIKGRGHRDRQQERDKIPDTLG